MKTFQKRFSQILVTIADHPRIARDTRHMCSHRGEKIFPIKLGGTVQGIIFSGSAIVSLLFFSPVSKGSRPESKVTGPNDCSMVGRERVRTEASSARAVERTTDAHTCGLSRVTRLSAFHRTWNDDERASRGAHAGYAGESVTERDRATTEKAVSARDRVIKLNSWPGRISVSPPQSVTPTSP